MYVITCWESQASSYYILNWFVLIVPNKLWNSCVPCHKTLPKFVCVHRIVEPCLPCQPHPAPTSVSPCNTTANTQAVCLQPSMLQDINTFWSPHWSVSLSPSSQKFKTWYGHSSEIEIEVNGNEMWTLWQPNRRPNCNWHQWCALNIFMTALAETEVFAVGYQKCKNCFSTYMVNSGQYHRLLNRKGVHTVAIYLCRRDHK